jgi:multicomponent K+:H+ antiporter subunit A
MILAFLVALPFIGSVIAALLPTNARNAESTWAGLVALICVVQVALLFPSVSDGGVIRQNIVWLPSAGLDLAIRMDGLAWMLAMLVTGIGALIVLYARYYMSPADPVPRFFSFLLAFMGAMMGLVLSGNLIQLVFFWELTSLFSFLLIGYWHHRVDARRGARMALIVHRQRRLVFACRRAAAGHIVGSYELDVVLASGDTVRAHPLYAVMLVLVLLGAFTKSAQFPFTSGCRMQWPRRRRFLLTCIRPRWSRPASSCWHRLWPVLAGTEEWFWIVGTVGLCTLLLGAYLAILPERPQGTARLFDDQPSRFDHAAAGAQQRAGRRRCRLPHHEPRDVQGLAVHGRGHHRP